MKVLVCSTLAPYVMAAGTDHRYWSSWLANAEAIREAHDGETDFFAALELGRDGLAIFAALERWLSPVDGMAWTFMLETGDKVITTANRLIRITMGQNLCRQYAMRNGYDAMLFVAADTKAPDDVIPRMLELGHPICAPNTPTYGLDGPRVEADYPPEWDVREHMASAACIFIHRKIFNRVSWRWDVDAGMTDDPCYHADALALGWPTLVRHDVVAEHFPACIGPIETRHSEAARRLT